MLYCSPIQATGTCQLRYLLTDMEIISTTNAPLAVGPYSQAVKVGEFIFTSGQIPLNPKTGFIVDGGIKEQTARTIENIKAVLEEAGSDLTRVVKTTCYLKNIADFAEFNAEYEKHFIGKPARSCVEVSALPKDALVEIEAIAKL